MNEYGPAPWWDEDYLAALADIASSLARFIARRVRGDTHAVEDLTQEVLIQVGLYVTHRDLSRSEMKRLAYKIAGDRIVDWYRRSGRSLLVPSDEVLLFEAVTDLTVGPADNVATSIDLKRALSRLTPQQRRTLALFYLDGLDRQSVADVMGISVDAVKKHLAKAKSKARQLDELAEYGRSRMPGEVRDES